MARQAARTRQRGEEHDGIAGQLDVVAQGIALLVSQDRDRRIELQGQKFAEIDGERFGRHG